MLHVFRSLNKISKDFQSSYSVLHFFRHCFASVSTKYNSDCLPSYLTGADDKTVKLIDENFKLHENFVSELEEDELIKEIDPIFKRRRYEKDHWDGAIITYRETEKTEWNEVNSKVLDRLRKLAFNTSSSLISSVHVLDLSKDGYIKPHIDSVKFCGDTIAGISLLSSSVMRLVMEDNKDIFVDILLPQRSLYIMKGIARYKFTHEILEDAVSYFKGKRIERQRRISVICRNEPIDIH